MQDIYIMVEDVNSILTVVEAAFDEDDVISKAGFEQGDFDEGYMDVCKDNKYGRMTIMVLEAHKYKDILEKEGIKSINEFASTLEIVDCNGDAFNVSIHKIFELLEESSEKAEWIEELGLSSSEDTTEDFDIEDMIINK